MNYIYWLSQIQHSEQSLVGDKLFVLSQLLHHEVPILPGLVLGNNLLRQFLANLDNSESLDGNLPNSFLDLDVDNYQTLQLVASRSRRIINQAAFPIAWQTEIFQAAQHLNADSLILQPFVTLPYRQHEGSRGMWRSHTCSANPEALATAIKLVWSELFTASSLFYWYKLGLSSEQIDLAVLIRPLKTAYASGIVEVASDLVRIKASWGLEHSLLQGDVEPDEYYVDRKTGYILSRHLGHKNYAYRPKNIDPATPLIDCLEAYIPGETYTEIYVLEQRAIAKLLQLTQIILEKQPQIKYLVWTAPEVEDRSISTPNFYFTQLNYHLASSTNLLEDQVTQVVLPTSSIQPLLTGIAASPGNVLAKVVVIEDFDTQPHPLTADCILVTKMIPPHQISLIKQVRGIITEIGGKTSHGAIIARELKIPAVVNALNATKILQDGVEVLLNGDDGKVYPAIAQRQLFLSNLSSEHLLSPTYPIATKLMVNLSQLESIANTVNLPIDGVGLLRSELMLGDLLAAKSLKQWQEESSRTQFLTTLTDSLRQFVTAFAPRPVFYRSIDWYAQDTLNPILGNRGTYSYLDDPTLFSLELEALAAITAEGYSNLNLILPFVRSVEEFKFCYRRLENIGLTAKNSFQVWIMAEVPSVILLLPEYVRAGVQGIAVGTNDLTQLLLGVDREQAHFSDRGLNANHPAMHKAISKLITIAQDNGIECCICGQAPVEYPNLIDELVKWGINAISVEPDAVNKTYKAIARAERRILLTTVKVNSKG